MHPIGTTSGSPSPPPTGRIVVISIAACLLLAYTVLRAFSVSFSWDETWTFIHHVRKGLFYQEVYDQMGANHHLLNVWGMWVCWKLFGAAEWSLRLPNLLAHACYLYASARIALRARTLWLTLGAFLLLNAHPYLLDFFSLARGYGLACGWLMLALWQLWRYVTEDRSRRSLVLAATFMALAVMAHLIMINAMIAFAIVLTLYELDLSRGKGIRPVLQRMVWPMVIMLVGLLLVLPAAVRLRGGGSLYFGCTTIWTGTVRTLGEKFLYHQGYGDPPLTIMGYVLLAITACCALYFIVAIRCGWTIRSAPVTAGLLLLAFILVSLWLQHLLLGVLWPQSRTALFLVPLIAFILVAALITWPAYRWLPSLLTAGFLVPLGTHLAKSANRTYAVEWKCSGEVRHMLDLITEDHVPFSPPRSVVSLASCGESMGCLPYYNEVRDLTWLTRMHRYTNGPFPSNDYYIVEYDAYDQVDPDHWSLVYRSESTGTSLYRDDRLRDPHPTVVYHASDDLERPDLSGRYTAKHVSGRQCIRSGGGASGPIELVWTVPEDWPGDPVMVCGSAMVDQTGEENWASLVLTLERGSETLDRRDAPSIYHIPRRGGWERVNLELRTNTPVQAGDRIRMAVQSLTDEPPVFVDDVELWITR